MSALAAFVAEHGAVVWGSDRNYDIEPNHKLYRMLKSKGISLAPQNGSGLDKSFDLVVFSTAVEPDHPEALRAKELALETTLRPDFLAGIINSFNSIAVSGTNGKSTTAGMLAFMMRELGMRPNYVGGGRVKQFQTQSNPGNSLSGGSDLLVAEACESDGSIVQYHPAISLISNLSLDHNRIDETEAMFLTLAENTRCSVVVNADDPNLKAALPQASLTYGIGKKSDVMAYDIVMHGFSSKFKIEDVSFETKLPGRHNLYNALAAVAVLKLLDIPLAAMVNPLSDFRGIDRRFDIHLDKDGFLVVDDYAHNPQKIAALMQTVSAERGKTCYIFQPHGFGPTRLLKNGYVQTFRSFMRKEDQLFILPIYYAGGDVHRDISSEDLVSPLRNSGYAAEVLPSRNDLYDRLEEWSTFIVFGARDESLSDLAQGIADRLLAFKKHL